AIRSSSSSKCDCSSVFCSQQVGSVTRLPAHKCRFHGYPDKSPKECIFWCPGHGHGRWCFMCSKNAHCPVPIPTHKHSLSHRARAHKTDSDRLRFKHVPTSTTLCMSHGFCKNETNVHSLHSSERCFRCDKCARCPAPTSTHRHDSSHGNRPALPLAVDHRRGVERGQSARCYQRAPCLK
ncbi:hypothetical protein PO909_023419, partial [Leuciscus waleckii]